MCTLLFRVRARPPLPEPQRCSADSARFAPLSGVIRREGALLVGVSPVRTGARVRAVGGCVRRLRQQRRLYYQRRNVPSSG